MNSQAGFGYKYIVYDIPSYIRQAPRIADI